MDENGDDDDSNYYYFYIIDDKICHKKNLEQKNSHAKGPL